MPHMQLSKKITSQTIAAMEIPEQNDPSEPKHKVEIRKRRRISPRASPTQPAELARTAGRIAQERAREAEKSTQRGDKAGKKEAPAEF